jgi:hypothetical protein
VKQGYTIQGLESFGAALAVGESPVFIGAAPVAALTGGSISGAAQIATNIVSGKPIMNNVIVAASLGADFGGLYGATLPEGTSAVNVAKTVGLNAVKMGLSFGAFDAAVSVSVGAAEIPQNPVHRQEEHRPEANRKEQWENHNHFLS